jgi:predicted nuclease of predicted toxin-antitoxin system
VKLLFDHNLSPTLVRRLADVFSGSEHVYPLGLDRADDEVIWEYALRGGLAIVTKDADYNALSVVRGHPPKVVWLLLGNCTTREVEALFRARQADLEAFAADPAIGTFLLR